MTSKKVNDRFSHKGQFSVAATILHLVTHLLLASTNALRVEVPMRVQVANGHPEILHSDYRAIRQVWGRGKTSDRYQAAGRGMAGELLQAISLTILLETSWGPGQPSLES